MGLKSKKTLRTALIILLAIIFCLCLFVMIRALGGYKSGADIYEKAQFEFTAARPKESPAASDVPAAAEVPQAPIAVDFAKLREISPDVVGWIFIDGTDINYPIVQGEDNEKYLDTTYDGKKNSSGSIFLDSRQSADFTEKNTIIYGHNMANGTMFAGLLGYYEQGFYEEHKYVFIITETETLTYEVFSAYITDEVSEAYNSTFESPEAFDRFVAGAVRKSWLKTDVKPSERDKVITLSTCTKPGAKERFVVHARLAV